MTRVEVAIVGAGIAGIGMASALRRAGRDDFVVLERAASVGGTWRDNTYPGVACDVPSHLYGFAAHPNPSWSGTYARGAEIHAYLDHVVDAEGIRDRVRLRTAMQRAEWDAEHEVWRIHLGTAVSWPETPEGSDTDAAPAGEVILADALVLACGRLTEPSIPRIAGLETFPGPLFHSARWDHSADLAGARVGVVGTGASAIQIVPALARTAAHVTLLQRTPAWIVPRGGDDYSDAERARFATTPQALESLRADLYAEGEARFASRAGDSAAAAEAEAVARAHLERQVRDPALRAALTPDYAFGCKRVLLSDEFYPAVASDAVTLVPEALTAVEGSTLVAADGSRHEVDALVLATGFASTRQPYAELVAGERGRTLAEHWSGGMTAFASTVVAGFPNLFVLNGPNASLGHSSSVLMIEEQAAYVARVLDTRAGRVLRVDPDAERAYTDEIARAAASTRWITGGCRNWYVDDRSGRLTLLWPGTVDAFRDRLARADGSEFLPAPAPLAH
ncbi:NAD(P)/FAD-dependent oxidoreductase [Microbacterium sp. M3]|uniref:NAD(P)/FAD-dependent oxidoreductase n=1 Tax=Microbacterium arthrosphaerae TaxID=792652 RepID=A0ABU4GYK8_9MICO|nr:MULTISPECIES: NAD(P)/FAD-dependent oxidoreductase [Microbacterium]MDW4572172.1 NAD(P)/FAD-dependent oxidoreductase [Microbacterium arthrosphaerae]MDW7606027.1 NAD(P)/FAD-dependent oxidoreductase [Microbacterium sp. M3]